MKNKVVIITGASSGIGKALAFEAAINGMDIVVAARRMDLLETMATAIRKKYKVEVLAVKTDVSIEKDCENLINKSIEKFEKIDILINNAGISMRALFEDLDLSVVKRVMDVNYWGTVFCTKYALPYIKESHGSIVGVSSIAGYTGLPARTAYSASKFAVHGFLRSLRIEYLKQDIHIMIACPNFTASEIRKYALDKSGNMQGESYVDEGKLMSSELVAKKIMKAIKRRKNYLIITFMGKLIVLVSRLIPHMYRNRTYKHFAKESDSPLK